MSHRVSQRELDGEFPFVVFYSVRSRARTRVGHASDLEERESYYFAELLKQYFLSWRPYKLILARLAAVHNVHRRYNYKTVVGYCLLYEWLVFSDIV